MRRGIAQATLITLMILLVTAMVLWPILSQAAVWANSYVEGGSCQASVEMASFKWEKACFDLVTSPFSLNCPRRHIEVGDKITVIESGEQEVLEVPDYEEVNEDAVETLVLEELRSCWKKFDEGETRLFPAMSPNLGERFTSNGPTENYVACHICAEMTFEKDFQTSLQERLDTPMVGAEATYRQYFNNPDARCEDRFGSLCWNGIEELITEEADLNEEIVDRQRTTYSPTREITGSPPDVDSVRRIEGLDYGVTKMDTINSEKTYAVVIGRKRFDYCEENTQVAGATTEDTNFVYFVPHDELSDGGKGGLCDVIIS